MPNFIHGTFTITGDKNIYYTGKGSFNYGGHLEKREAVMHSGGGVAGYNIKSEEPYVVGKLTNNSDFSIRDLEQIENCTITLDLINGKQIVLRDAWTDRSKIEIKEKEKVISCRWNGTSIELPYI